MLFGLLVFAAGEVRAAQSIVQTEDRLMRIDADNVPLGILLDEFSKIARVESMIMDPALKNIRVTVSSKKDLREEDAINAILEASGINFVVYGGLYRPFRIFVGDPKDGKLAELSPTEELELRKPGPGRVERPEAPSRTPQPLPEEEPASPSPSPRRRATPSERASGFSGVVGPSAPFPGESTEPTPENGPDLSQYPPGALDPPRQRPQQTPRSQTPFRSTGFSFSTDAASLTGRPPAYRFGAVGAFLALGLGFGLVLVKDARPSDVQVDAAR